MTESYEDGNGGLTLRLRGYQLEMLEKSMQRNIVVAMDTGSGKTFIAVSRIKAELEMCPTDKIAWFLVPTVALAVQQHTVLSENIPAFQARVFSGADGVDRWSEQSNWDEVLQNIRIVVSTPQVLLDALIHGFVKMRKFALLVFDEAHHCQANHPYNRIMQHFYHTCSTEGGDQVPAILGLTASPVFNSKAGNLEDLERNLNAIGITPKLHREEMLRFVHQPQLIRLQYPLESSETPGCQALLDLGKIYAHTDIGKDPYVVQLMADPKTKNSIQLNKALRDKRTYCQDLIKGFYNKANNIYLELGSWATSYYIGACIKKFENGIDDINSDFDTLNMAEKMYLKRVFARVEVSADFGQDLQDGLLISSKVRTLIDYLTETEVTDFTGLIFVQTRAAVAVLAHIITLHTRTRNTFSVSTFVGASTNVGRKFSIGELLEIKNQKNTLDDLRKGRRNLVIATSALEEGIDVSACNNVVCFEKPPNLKSFIQRRGRARKSASKFAIMFEENSDPAAMSMWQDLEDEMRKAYMDDTRQLEQIQKLEESEEGSREFQVESTGAKLTLEDAVQHLYHFCATLPTSRYVDLRPVFQFSETGEKGVPKSITSQVTLPNSIDASVREARSRFEWTTERLARRDAAFEAYIALYKAGLVNEHLLPLRYDEEAVEARTAVEKRPSIVEVPAQLDLWSDFVAHEWQIHPTLYSSSVKIWHEGIVKVHMMMILPRPLPADMSFELYWDAKTTLNGTVRPSSSRPYSLEHMTSFARVTQLILRSIYQWRMNDDKTDLSCLFIPDGVEDFQLWRETNMGTSPALTLSDSSSSGSQIGLIRDLTRNRAPHILESIEPFPIKQFESGFDPASLPLEEYIEGAPFLRVIKLSKRSDFLHKISDNNQNMARETGFRYLSASQCEVDTLPIKYAQFALLIPSIMHQVEIHILAEHLCSNLLSHVEIKDLKHVISAISASVARESTNYQRLEFLGDSVLKMFTSLTLVAEHLNWHEGILSGKKDHLVSNARLASSALNVGLAKYIRTLPFTGHKWRPLYNSDLLNDRSRTPRDISTKVLADVVEALIGASYIDGSQEKVLACLKIFLPEVSWASLSQQHQILYDVYDYNIRYPPHFEQLENLIQHTFILKTLTVEALTHPSHQGPNSCASYQRLEFLGDSILDNIVVSTAYNHQPHIPTPALHLIRTALVNANFLAFLCFTLSTPVTRSELVLDQHSNFSTIQKTTNLHIWQFMRHTALSIHTVQQACLTRYDTIRDATLDALNHGQDYPWALLARFDAPKFFSDIIESLIGAIYIDTHGSTTACTHFLDVLGVMPYLRRVISGEVALMHPKEELGVLAKTEKVKYVRDREVGEEDQEVEGPGLTCTVWVGEREVVTVTNGISVVEVETRAAHEAVRMLKSEGSLTVDEVIDENPIEENELEDEPMDSETSNSGGGVSVVDP